MGQIEYVNKLLPNIELRLQMIARTTLALMILMELK